MLENQKIAAATVIGPLGEARTMDLLPPPSTSRWVVRRKSEVLAAVRGGILSVDQACKRYSISLEEFTGWQRAVERSGMPGLSVGELVTLTRADFLAHGSIAWSSGSTVAIHFFQAVNAENWMRVDRRTERRSFEAVARK